MFYVVDIIQDNNPDVSYRYTISLGVYLKDLDWTHNKKLNKWHEIDNFTIHIFDDTDNSVECYRIYDLMKYVAMGIKIKGIGKRKTKNAPPTSYDITIRIDRPSFSEYFNLDKVERYKGFNPNLYKRYGFSEQVTYIAHNNKLFYFEDGGLTSKTIIKQDAQVKKYGDKLGILPVNTLLIDCIGIENKVNDYMNDYIRSGDLTTICVDVLADLVRYFPQYQSSFIGIDIVDNKLIIDTLQSRLYYSFDTRLCTFFIKRRLAGYRF